MEEVETTTTQMEEGAPFQCPDCERTFLLARALGAHRLHSHGVAGKTHKPAHRKRAVRVEPVSHHDTSPQDESQEFYLGFALRALLHETETIAKENDLAVKPFQLRVAQLFVAYATNQ